MNDTCVCFKIHMHFLKSLTLNPKSEFRSLFLISSLKSSLDSFYTYMTIPIYFILDPLLVLIEYVPYGDLLGYLRKSRGLNDTYFNNPDRKPKTNLTSQQLMRFAWQIADGMTYLSSRKVSINNKRNSTSGKKEETN